jgi:predicted nuclease of restriction endonuclease-like RecB superfamily
MIKSQLLTKDNDNEIIKEYEIKKRKLEDYWTIEFPKTYKIIETELKAIDSVKNSLDNNAAKLVKASTRLNNQFKDKIIKGLSKILGDLIIQEEIVEKQN